MTPQAQALVDQAVAQGRGRVVRDPVALARIASIVATAPKVGTR